MVKLNLTGLQSSNSNETPAWEQVPETTEVAKHTEEAPTSEQPSYSFSLSSLIGNTNSTTTQETTNTTETISTDQETVDIQQTEEQPKTESLLSMEWISWETNTNNNEEVISIFSNWDNWNTEETPEVEASTTQDLSNKSEENREFFKSFDVIKEFSEEKWDEIVIGKWEATIKDESKQEELKSVNIMAEDNENILEESKNVAEIAVAQVDETMAPSMTIMQSAPINLDINNDDTNQVTTWESITWNVAETVTAENTATPTTDIEQTKKDLSATRKPFWIKSFSKKNVIVSLWAIFVIWLATFWISQMDSLGGKASVQETPPIIKYVSWTDYTVIANKNKKKNIRRSREEVPMNSWAEIGTWEQLNNTWILLENSWATTMTGITTSTSTWTEMNSWTTSEKPVSPSAAMMPQSGEQPAQGPSQTPRELQWPNNIPAIQPTNTPANDLNDIANWAN